MENHNSKANLAENPEPQPETKEAENPEPQPETKEAEKPEPQLEIKRGRLTTLSVINEA